MRETVRPFEHQPFGLERACVEKLASPNGKIYVDVAFIDTAYRAGWPEPDCIRDNYVIRFDGSKHVPPATSDVVLFLVSDYSAGKYTFNARIDTANWRQRKATIVTLSRCGSAYGRVQKLSAGWQAVVTAPPRSADAL